MRKLIVFVVLGCTLIAVGVVVYAGLSKPKTEIATEPVPSQPDPKQHTPMDVDIVKKMLIYHQQAVELADIILQKSASTDMRQFAQDIKAKREANITKFKAWLAEWNEPYMNLADFPQQSGHDMYPTLPGMTTPEELQKLRTHPATELDQNVSKIMKMHYGGIAEFMKESRQSLQFGELAEAMKDLQTIQTKEETALNKLLEI